MNIIQHLRPEQRDLQLENSETSHLINSHDNHDDDDDDDDDDFDFDFSIEMYK